MSGGRAFCDRRLKVVAMVDREGNVVGVSQTFAYNRRSKTARAGLVAEEAEGLPRVKVEVDWSVVFDRGPGGNQSREDDAPLLQAVAILSCDGSRKLPAERIGRRDGLPAECRLESCMEISNGTPHGGRDRGDFRGPPIANTFAQARELVAEIRRQGVPVRRLHHPTRDHKRIHCVGRLVRRSAAERAAEAREWAAACREKADAVRVERVAAKAATDTLRCNRIAAVELARAARLEAEAERLESLE